MVITPVASLPNVKCPTSPLTSTDWRREVPPTGSWKERRKPFPPNSTSNGPSIFPNVIVVDTSSPVADKAVWRTQSPWNSKGQNCRSKSKPEASELRVTVVTLDVTTPIAEVSWAERPLVSVSSSQETMKSDVTRETEAEKAKSYAPPGKDKTPEFTAVSPEKSMLPPVFPTACTKSPSITMVELCTALTVRSPVPSCCATLAEKYTSTSAPLP